MTINRLVQETAFTWLETKDDRLLIAYHGKQVMILKGNSSTKLLSKLTVATPEEQQLLLAKITGNFKRRNEKSTKRH